jgi:cell division protein FtsW
MSALPVDVTPSVLTHVPQTRMGTGWEPAALLGLSVLLLAFGLVNLYSASAFLAQRQGLGDTFYVLRQAFGAAIGLALLAACAWTPYTWWKALAWPLVWASFLALAITVLPWTEPWSPEINGARRWIRVGFTLQPSELAKMAMVIWTAHLAVRKQDQFRSLSRGLAPFLLVWLGLILPILLQPDLSTAFLLALLGGIVVFAAGARIGHFLFLLVAFAPMAVVQLSTGFRLERIRAFLSDGGETAGAGYQVHQSMIALGSGGPVGVGFGEGRQKFGFLPEPHNDFIFSMIGEEWGFLGTGALILLYLSLVLLGFRIAGRPPDLFGQLLAVGLTSMIALHASLHMAVGLGLIPPTGLSLPLVSYGRSNLLVTLATIGVLISVARGDPRARRAHD